MALLVLALLACGFDSFDLDLGGERDWGDSGWFAAECESDEQCTEDECCDRGLFSSSCVARVPTDPTESVCSTSGDDQEVLCICLPPQGESVCPGWFLNPPFNPECKAQAYSRCVVLCPERICVCETTDTGVLGDAGAEVPSCPPPDWAASCPSDGGA